MSSFSGFIDDFPGISIDSFTINNLSANTYFLSHRHEDHMVGLLSTGFAYHLQSNCRKKLYCSKISEGLLRNDQAFDHIADHLVGLTQHEAHRIEIPEWNDSKKSTFITVTLIPADHCPGSVMFLFEKDDKTVLYTGDFRLESKPLYSITELHVNNVVRHIDQVYCDTTFCVPEALYIPPRSASIRCVEELTRQWITQGRHYVVLILQSAALGYEPLFIHLAKVFNTKVHTSRKQHAQYKNIKGLSDFSTLDTNTQIHACTKRGLHYKGLLPCDGGDKRDLQVRVIKVSTMWFTSQCTATDYCVPLKAPYIYRVCYSLHSSYSEIRDFLSYLKPDHAIPNVVPKDCALAQVTHSLQKFLNVAKDMNADLSHESKPLGELRKMQKRAKLEILSQTDSEFDFGDEEADEHNCIKHHQSSSDSLCTDKYTVANVKQTTSEDCEKPNQVEGIVNTNSSLGTKRKIDQLQTCAYSTIVTYVSSDSESDDDINEADACTDGNNGMEVGEEEAPMHSIGVLVPDGSSTAATNSTCKHGLDECNWGDGETGCDHRTAKWSCGDDDSAVHTTVRSTCTSPALPADDSVVIIDSQETIDSDITVDNNKDACCDRASCSSTNYEPCTQEHDCNPVVCIDLTSNSSDDDDPNQTGGEPLVSSDDDFVPPTPQKSVSVAYVQHR